MILLLLVEVDHSSSGAQLALSASVQVTATCCPHLAMAHSQDFYLGSVFFSVVILSRSWNGSQWWGKQRIFLMGKVFSSLLAGVLISLQSLSVRCNVAGAACGQNHVHDVDNFCTVLPVNRAAIECRCGLVCVWQLQHKCAARND